MSSGKERFQNTDGVASLEQQKPNFWEQMQEHQLAAAVNGEVFLDESGIFTAVREVLSGYYPDMVWRKKLAQGLHDFSQYAQSNYPRMMARKDIITAKLCVAKAMEAAMDLVYLLRKEYAPYYKWKKKGLEKMALRRDVFPLVHEILPLLEKVAELPVQMQAWEQVSYSAAFVNEKDECVRVFAFLVKGPRHRRIIGSSASQAICELTTCYCLAYFAMDSKKVVSSSIRFRAAGSLLA